MASFPDMVCVHISAPRAGLACPASPSSPPARSRWAPRPANRRKDGPCQPSVYALGLGVSGAAASWSAENVLKKHNWGGGSRHARTIHPTLHRQAEEERSVGHQQQAASAHGQGETAIPWSTRSQGRRTPAPNPHVPPVNSCSEGRLPFPFPPPERESSVPLRACLSRASPQLPYFCSSQITLDLALRDAYLFLLKGWQSPTFCGSHGTDPPSEGELRRLLPGWALAAGGPRTRPDAWKSGIPGSLSPLLLWEQCEGRPVP